MYEQRLGGAAPLWLRHCRPPSLYQTTMPVSDQTIWNSFLNDFAVHFGLFRLKVTQEHSLPMSIATSIFQDVQVMFDILQQLFTESVKYRASNIKEFLGRMMHWCKRCFQKSSVFLKDVLAASLLNMCSQISSKLVLLEPPSLSRS